MRRLTHDADNIEDSNNREVETMAPNKSLVEDKEVFNDDNKGKKVMPDRVMAEDKELLDEHHHKAKV